MLDLVSDYLTEVSEDAAVELSKQFIANRFDLSDEAVDNLFMLKKIGGEFVILIKREFIEQYKYEWLLNDIAVYTKQFREIVIKYDSEIMSLLDKFDIDYEDYQTAILLKDIYDIYKLVNK